MHLIIFKFLRNAKNKPFEPFGQSTDESHHKLRPLKNQRNVLEAAQSHSLVQEVKLPVAFSRYTLH